MQACILAWLAKGPIAKVSSVKGLVSVVVDSLFIVTPLVSHGFVFGPCFVMLYALSSFVIITLRRRELVALL